MKSQNKNYRRVFVKLQSKRGPTREYLWVETLSKDAARVANTPFFTDDVAFEDVVRVSESDEGVEVLRRETQTRRAIFDPPRSEDDFQRVYRTIAEYMGQFNIKCEGGMGGAFRMALPLDFSDERLSDNCSRCPVPFGLVSDKPPTDRKRIQGVHSPRSGIAPDPAKGEKRSGRPAKARKPKAGSKKDPRDTSSLARSLSGPRMTTSAASCEALFEFAARHLVRRDGDSE